jgi:hypothetical protein
MTNQGLRFLASGKVEAGGGKGPGLAMPLAVTIAIVDDPRGGGRRRESDGELSTVKMFIMMITWKSTFKSVTFLKICIVRSNPELRWLACPSPSIYFKKRVSSWSAQP